MSGVEKIDSFKKRAYEKFMKKWTNRKRRRAEKRDPENAGKRLKDFTHGWTS